MSLLGDSDARPSGEITLQEVLDFVRSLEARKDGYGTLTCISFAAANSLFRLSYPTLGDLPPEVRTLWTCERSETTKPA